MRSRSTDRNCLDILQPVGRWLEANSNDRLVARTQILGGIGVAALLSPETIVDRDQKTVIASEDLVIPQYRANGTLRDVDILVPTADTRAKAAIEDSLANIIGNDLELSVFGIHAISKLREQTRDTPYALGAFMADRFAEENADGTTSYTKGLSPFAVALPDEALERWRLQVGNDTILPIQSPESTIMNYLTRSPSGLREKDRLKTNQLVYNALEDDPEMRERIIDGSGHSQFHLARIFHTLREPARYPQSLTLGDPDDSSHQLVIGLLDQANLLEDDAFMFRDRPLQWQRQALGALALKSRAIRWVEKHDNLVSFHQHFLEPQDFIKRFTHNA